MSFGGRQAPRRERIDLESIAREAASLLRASLPPSIEIRSRFEAGLPRVHADATQLQQVIVNLIANALDALAGRGRIEIGAGALDVDAGTADGLPGLAEGPCVQLWVEDDGCGMDEPTLARAFEPFFTTKSAGQGAGLGLSVVHGIVREHGGILQVRSALGRGTRFAVLLPAAGPQAAAAPPARASTAAAPQRGTRVLYVDDDEALSYLAARALRRLGFEVTAHVDPREALRCFGERPAAFDVLITDVSMPALSGAELIAALRRIRPELPVVMTSGYIRPSDASDAERLGVLELVLKPKSVEEFARMLSGAIGPGAPTAPTSQS